MERGAEEEPFVCATLAYVLSREKKHSSSLLSSSIPFLPLSILSPLPLLCSVLFAPKKAQGWVCERKKNKHNGCGSQGGRFPAIYSECARARLVPHRAPVFSCQTADSTASGGRLLRVEGACCKPPNTRVQLEPEFDRAQAQQRSKNPSRKRPEKTKSVVVLAGSAARSRAARLAGRFEQTQAVLGRRCGRIPTHRHWNERVLWLFIAAGGDAAFAVCAAQGFTRHPNILLQRRNPGGLAAKPAGSNK